MRSIQAWTLTLRRRESPSRRARLERIDGPAEILSGSQKTSRLTLPISRNTFRLSRTDKGRVASVFVDVERVAVAATMPGPFCFRDFDLGADQGRRRQNGRTAQVHVRATARTNGTSVGTSDASWDMQQAEKSIACGTQALSCFCGGLSSSTARPCALRAYGCPVP
jgi:hypothetical protein